MGVTRLYVFKTEINMTPLNATGCCSIYLPFKCKIIFGMLFPGDLENGAKPLNIKDFKNKPVKQG